MENLLNIKKSWDVLAKEFGINEKTPLSLRIQAVGLLLDGLALQKTGVNAFAKFNYFQLSDFLPALKTALLLARVPYKIEVELNEPMDSWDYTLKCGSGEEAETWTHSYSNKGLNDIGKMTDVQKKQALTTYATRHLLVLAFGISENDTFDAVSGTDALQKSQPKQAPQQHQNSQPTQAKQDFKKNDEEDDNKPWINEKIMNGDEFTKTLSDLKAQGTPVADVVKITRRLYKVSKKNAEIIEEMYDMIETKAGGISQPQASGGLPILDDGRVGTSPFISRLRDKVKAGKTADEILNDLRSKFTVSSSVEENIVGIIGNLRIELQEAVGEDVSY